MIDPIQQQLENKFIRLTAQELINLQIENKVHFIKRKKLDELILGDIIQYGYLVAIGGEYKKLKLQFNAGNFRQSKIDYSILEFDIIK